MWRAYGAIALSAVVLCYWGAASSSADTAANADANGNWGLGANWSTSPTVPINGSGGGFAVTVSGYTITYNLTGSGQIDSLLLSSSTLNLNSGCNLAVLDSSTITQSNIQATASTFSDPAASALSSSFAAQGGGSISLSALATYQTNSSTSGTFQANNANSTVQLPALTTVNENGWGLTLQATNGGYVNAPLFSTVTYSGSGFENLALTSEGANSVVNVPSLGSGPLTKLNVYVQGGGSVLWGSPTNIQSSTLTLDGSGTLNTAALTNLTSSSLTATNGATLAMPGLATYATNSTGSGTFTASNANSQLQLPALTTVNENGWGLTLQATNGGYVNAPLFSTVTYSGSGFENLALTSEGANSVVNVPSLGSGPLTRLSVYVQGGGSVLWGSPTNIQSSTLTLDGSGTLNTAALSNLTSSSLTATNGATLAMPGLATYATNSTGSGTFTASNANSQLQLPALTTVNENGWGLTLQATNGGYVNAPLFTTVTYSGSGFENLALTSEAANSVVNVPSLGSGPLTRLSVYVQSGGSVLWGSPTNIQSSTLTLDGSGTLNTAALSNLTSSSLTATNGATLTMPALVTYATNSTGSGTFTASNANSQLQLPALTTVNENGWGLTLQATNGGYVNAPLFTTVTYSGSGFENLALTSEGANSVVNVPSLGSGPLTKVSVYVQGGGSVLWGSPTNIESSTLTLDGSGALNTAALSNLTSSSLTATNGATFSMPALVTYATNSIGSGTFTASNAGSKLQLPALTTVNEHGWGLTLQATNGGSVSAPLLNSITYSGSVFENLALTSEGANSVVNVPSLGSGPLTRLNVYVQGGGSVLWGSPATIQSSTLTLDGSGTLNTAALTNIDSSSLTATNGATLALPSLVTYRTNSTGSGTFTASNPNSVLSLPALTTINENGWGVTVNASNGGHVDLHALQTITGTGSPFEGFTVNITGAGSSVDLSGLTSIPGSSNGLTLGDMGQVSLQAAGSATSVSFQAEFTNANGALDVYVNGSLIDSIAPNNLNTWEAYQLPLTDPPSSSLIELEAAGSGAAIDVADYSAMAAPEPAAAAMLLAPALMLLRRRRTGAAASH